MFPEIKPKLSRWTNYEKISISITESDIDLAIKDIVKRYGDWKDVKRKAKKEQHEKNRQAAQERQRKAKEAALAEAAAKAEKSRMKRLLEFKLI